MSRPGENHDSDTVTAATLMTAVTTVSTRATRRFPVISVRLTHWLTVRAAARTASRGRDRPAATMMAALYPPTGTSGTRPRSAACADGASAPLPAGSAPLPAGLAPGR